MMNMPFEIGSTWWTFDPVPYQIVVPCPVCAGQLFFLAILGSGERIAVECDACGKGYEGPRGVIYEYRHAPIARPFVIASIVSYHADNDEWYLKSEAGGSAYFKALYATESEALAAGQKRAAKFEEECIQSRQRKQKRGIEKGWSVHYHREQIKDLERQIAWHRSKIEAKEAR